MPRHNCLEMYGEISGCGISYGLNDRIFSFVAGSWKLGFLFLSMAGLKQCCEIEFGLLV